jgi:site-specific DNA-methyltransferase (adenine-specific)
MEYMRGIPDKFFELAVVDPPYGIGEDGSTNKSRGKLGKAKDYKGFTGGDKKPMPKEFFDELKRISMNQIVWGANHFISLMPFDSSCWIVWDKENGATDFADCELAYTSFQTAVRIFKYRWQGMLQADMKNKETRIHPTQKPVALYEWLLTNYAKAGDKILDTHMGSQSSRIAAWRLGFDYYGCELDKDYFNDGCKRFEQERAKQSLFKPADIVHKQTTIF